MTKEISISTSKRNELINITDQVKEIIRKSKIKEGVCLIYVPHATAGITINEGADPNLAQDLLDKLSELVPQNASYRHSDGNADAHIKSSLVGVSVSVLIKNAKLILGTWQAIFFCEFDGPRERKVVVEILD